MTARTTIRDPRAKDAQGQQAGMVSRILANAIDLGVAWVLTFVGLGAWSAVRYVAFGDPLQFPRPEVSFTVGLFWLVLVLYLTDGWAESGKTVGKRIMGLRVEAVDVPLRGRGWLLRAVLCVSFAPLLLGWALVARDRRGIHDKLLGTRVVYDWSRT